MSTNLTIEGIVYAGTQDESAGANTLDDYEEGTWTPVFNYQNATAESNKAFTTQLGIYSKIGRRVFAHMQVHGTYSGGTADNVAATTPFVAANPAQQGGSFRITGGFNGASFSTYTNGQAQGSFSNHSGTGNVTQFLSTSFACMGYFDYNIAV